MHIRWIRRQLRTNHQSGILVCTHFDVDRPWVLYPYLVHRYEQAVKDIVIWQPGPAVRECCIASKAGHALSHWWWTVNQRFNKLQTEGLEDQEITKALLEQLDYIEGYLEEVVPKPTQDELQGYMAFRQDLGLPDYEELPTRRNYVPTCIKVLGIEAWPCTLDVLTQRWRELALQHHPDHQGDADVFRRYHEAYTKAKALVRKTAP